MKIRLKRKTIKDDLRGIGDSITYGRKEIIVFIKDNSMAARDVKLSKLQEVFNNNKHMFKEMIIEDDGETLEEFVSTRYRPIKKKTK